MGRSRSETDEHPLGVNRANLQLAALLGVTRQSLVPGGIIPAEDLCNLMDTYVFN